MRAKQFRIKSDACYPLGEKPSVLARCHASAVALMACEQVLAWLLGDSLQVVVNGLTGLICQLELDWSPCLLLPYRCAIDRIAIRCNIFDLQSHHIAAAQLAVDGQVEQGEVAGSPLDQQSGSDRPDMLWAQWRRVCGGECWRGNFHRLACSYSSVPESKRACTLAENRVCFQRVAFVAAAWDGVRSVAFDPTRTLQMPKSKV